MRTRAALVLYTLVALVSIAVATGAASARPARAGDAFKAAWIYVGPDADGGWSQAHDQGRLAVQKALGSKVQTTYKDLGMQLPRISWQQQNVGVEVPSLDQAQPGDVLAFGEPAYHVAIYIGNGKFIHAQNESTGVVISDLSSTYYSSRWYGARRIAYPTKQTTLSNDWARAQ